MKLAKFRRTHLEETLPEWRDKFLCYKLLKKLLKRLPATAATIATVDSLPRHLEFQLANAHLAVADGGDEFHPLGGLFVPILNEELKKLNDFYVDKKEEFVIRFQSHLHSMNVAMRFLECEGNYRFSFLFSHLQTAIMTGAERKNREHRGKEQQWWSFYFRDLQERSDGHP